MSADSIDLDGLERKDRAELATIAQALGGKPTSRAKKADIITMILDLAGVTGPAPATPEPSGAATATAATAEAPTTPAAADDVPTDEPTSEEPSVEATPRTAARRVSTGRGAPASPAEPSNGGGPRGRAPQRISGGPGNAPTVDEPSGDRGGRSGSTDSPAPSGNTRNQDAGRNGGNGNNGGGSNGNNGGGSKDDQRSADHEDDAADTGNQQLDTHHSDAQQGEGQTAEGEGRRRRRRRGRDRDRTEDAADGSQQWEGELIEVSGVLDLRDEGYGFLRVAGLLPSRDDVYVSVKQTRQFGLRRGDWLTGASRPANRGEKNPALLRIDTVNDLDPERSRDRPSFDDLVPVFPSEHLRLEREDHPYDMTSRIIDLIAPIGKGQRGLIVSPPKAGKTTIMKTIAQAIEDNHPEVELMVLLVDERPEEVTDMRRSIKGEVVASTFDRPAEEHTQVAELAIERAKRMVEQGSDVVVILDGITRLARAYNLAAPNGGRIMSGGLDTGALYPPKRLFGAARNIEDGGSLTILATALVDTNSKMDEVIFEEFKGTGNMELRLDRSAAEKRVYPAIDVDASSTRHEELLIDPDRLQQVWKLRRLLSALAAQGEPAAGLELVVDRMRKFPTNEVFLAEIAKGPAVG